jgi:hypothetical protein
VIDPAFVAPVSEADALASHFRALLGEPPRRGAEQVGEEQPQPLVRAQDGEQLDRGRHPPEGTSSTR